MFKFILFQVHGFSFFNITYLHLYHQGCLEKQDRNTDEDIHALQFMLNFTPPLYDFKIFCSDFRTFFTEGQIKRPR